MLSEMLVEENAVSCAMGCLDLVSCPVIVGALARKMGDAAGGTSVQECCQLNTEVRSGVITYRWHNLFGALDYFHFILIFCG